MRFQGLISGMVVASTVGGVAAWMGEGSTLVERQSQTQGNNTLDLAYIIKNSPLCSQLCTLDILSRTTCKLPDMRTCLCPNSELQAEIGHCVITKCTLTEQFATTTLFQGYVCKGIAQASRSEDIPRALIILTCLTFPILLLRFISRWLIARYMWWDDWLILFAGALLIPQTALLLNDHQEGFGRHFWDIPLHRVTPLRKMFYATQILYCVIHVLPKLSILCLYLRIFTNKGFRWATFACIGFIITHSIIYITCIVLQCLPVSAIWTLEPARCLNLTSMVYSAAGVSIFEDFFILLLPVWELRKLHLSTRKKVELTIMFGLGSFATITSMIRLGFVAKFSRSVDVTWDNVDVIVWSVIENFVAVICACVLCIRPLVTLLFSAITGKSTETDQISRRPHQVINDDESNKATWNGTGTHVKMDEIPSERKESEEDEIYAGRERRSGMGNMTKVWIVR